MSKKYVFRFVSLVLAMVVLFGDLCQPVKAWTGDLDDLHQKAWSNAAQGKYFAAISCMEKKLQERKYYLYDGDKRGLLRDFGLFQTSYISAGENKSALIHGDGTVTVTGSNYYAEGAANQWTDITAVSMGKRHIIGLKTDGTVVAVGSNKSGRCNVSSWQDIVAIAAGGHHTVGMTSEGRLVATGYNSQGQCQVDQIEEKEGWYGDNVAIAAGKSHTLALTRDGKVFACGSNDRGACQVEDWTDIVSICAGDDYSAGLKEDGTVVVAGKPTEGWNLSGWRNIVQLAAGDSFLVGLKENGRVITVGTMGGYFRESLEPVDQWKNVGVIAAGENHIVALTRDGTILTAGYNNYHQCEFSDVQGEEPVGLRDIHYCCIIKEQTNNLVGVIQKWGKDGNLCWEYVTEDPDYGSMYGPMAVITQAGDRLYFAENVHGNGGNYLVCLDTNTGEVIWKNRNTVGGSSAFVVDTDGTIYLVCYEGNYFLGVDKEGKTTHNIRIDGSFLYHEWMRKVDDTVYVAFSDGLPEGEVYLFAIDLLEDTCCYEGQCLEKDLAFY